MLPGRRRAATSSTCSPFGLPRAPAPIVPKFNGEAEDGNQDVATLVGHAELANNLSEDVLFVLKVRSMGQCHSIDNLALFSPPHLDFFVSNSTILFRSCCSPRQRRTSPEAPRSRGNTGGTRVKRKAHRRTCSDFRESLLNSHTCRPKLPLRAPPLAPRADGHVMLHALPVLVRSG